MSYSRFIQKNVVHWVQKQKLSNAHNFAIVHSIFTNRLSKCLIKNKNAIYSVQFYSPGLYYITHMLKKQKKKQGKNNIHIKLYYSEPNKKGLTVYLSRESVL